MQEKKIVVILFLFWPFVLTEGAGRLVNHNTFYKIETPFKFDLLNDSLTVQKGNDFEVKVSMSGEHIPSSVSIYFGGNNFVMNKLSKTEYSYSFRNINNSLRFSFVSEGYVSQKYTIEVLPSPVIVDFQVLYNNWLALDYRKPNLIALQDQLCLP